MEFRNCFILFTKKNVMENFILIATVVSLSSLVAWRWMKGIDYMHTNYPDYKGEDLFDENLSNEKKTNKRRKAKKSSN